MAASQTRRAARHTSGTRTRVHARKHAKRVTARPAKTAAKSVRPVRPVHKVGGKAALVPVEPVAFRFCKSGWAVLVDRQPNQQGTRFVCPFCTQSHRVSGPVRGFRKMRRAQWMKLRRVDE